MTGHAHFLDTNIFPSIDIYALLTKREVKMAGYWPHFFFFFCVFMDRDKVKVLKNAKKKKKNKANIQPS